MLHSLVHMRQFMPLVFVLAGAAAATGAYLQALGYPFVFDDTSYITGNTKLAGLRPAELWRLFTGPYNSDSEFLPLRELSYWLDMTLFGLNPSAFRLHNILLYLLCLPLVYGVTSGLWRYFRPVDAASAPWAAAAVTALFALHPAHVEAVVWISGRKDILSAMFSLLALWFAVNARREPGLSAPYAAAALVALLAAMLSKATAVAVAPVIALLWVCFWRDIPASNRRRSLLLWPFAGLVLAVCVALVFAAIITSRVPMYFGVEAAIRTLAVLGWLVRLSISPESRHFLYPVFEDPYLSLRAALGVAALLSALAGGIMLMRKRSLEGFAMIAFLLLCAPSLQLVPYAPPSLASDRFVVLAVWPVLLLLVTLSWRLNPVLRVALLLAIALPWGFQTFERTRDWRSQEALLNADLRAYPGYYMPALYKVIGQLSHGLHNEAIRVASGITDPEFRDVVIGLVKADHAVANAVVTGKAREAMELLRELWLDHKQMPAQAQWNSPIKNLWITRENLFAVDWVRLARSFPEDMQVRYNTGLALLNIQEYEYAIPHLRAATESQNFPEPMRGTAFYSLGLALLKSGQVAEAETPLHVALQQSTPELLAHCALSEVYKQAGRIEEAAHAIGKCPGRVQSKR